MCHAIFIVPQMSRSERQLRWAASAAERRERDKEKETERDKEGARAFQLLHQVQRQATLFFETIQSSQS
jgi:hypothetical protein